MRMRSTDFYTNSDENGVLNFQNIKMRNSNIKERKDERMNE